MYNPTVVGQEGGEEFLRGTIGVLGPLGRWKVPRRRDVTTRFKWDCVPVPHQVQSASIVFYTAWSMATASPHPKECYQLIKYLTGAQGQILAAHLGLAIPSLKSVAYSDDFLNPPGMPKHNSQAFLDAVNVARIQQVPREPEWSRICAEEDAKGILLGVNSPPQMAAEIKRRHGWNWIPPLRWGIGNRCDGTSCWALPRPCWRRNLCAAGGAPAANPLGRSIAPRNVPVGHSSRPG